MVFPFIAGESDFGSPDNDRKCSCIFLCVGQHNAYKICIIFDEPSQAVNNVAIVSFERLAHDFAPLTGDKVAGR
jgi:hypothetical protein